MVLGTPLGLGIRLGIIVHTRYGSLPDTPDTPGTPVPDTPDAPDTPDTPG